MSKKSTDIDALIGNDRLEITIGGKTYTVKDVPLHVFLDVAKDEGTAGDPKILHNQLARLFEVDVETLGNIGYRAAALAIKEIQSWLFDAVGVPMPTDVLEASSEEPINP